MSGFQVMFLAGDSPSLAEVVDEFLAHDSDAEFLSASNGPNGASNLLFDEEYSEIVVVSDARSRSVASGLFSTVWLARLDDPEGSDWFNYHYWMGQDDVEPVETIEKSLVVLGSDRNPCLRWEWASRLADHLVSRPFLASPLMMDVHVYRHSKGRWRQID